MFMRRLLCGNSGKVCGIFPLCCLTGRVRNRGIYSPTPIHHWWRVASWVRESPQVESQVRAVRSHWCAQEWELLEGHVRAPTASATQHIPIKRRLFFCVFFFLVGSTPTMWCSLEYENKYTMLLVWQECNFVTSHGRFWRKAEKERGGRKKIAQSPFPSSL